jgi:hypothetical protein
MVTIDHLTDEQLGRWDGECGRPRRSGVADGMAYSIGHKAGAASRRRHNAEEPIRVLWNAMVDDDNAIAVRVQAAIALLRWGKLGDSDISL